MGKKREMIFKVRCLSFKTGIGVQGIIYNNILYYMKKFCVDFPAWKEKSMPFSGSKMDL